jgi:hypothetical protein
LGDVRAAQRAVTYLAVFPYSFFLQALYSEATFLVCAIAAFLSAERKRFLAAGVLAGAAMLARPTGIAVLAGLAAMGLRDAGRRVALTRLAVAPFIFCVFPILLALQGRSPLEFLTAEHQWRKYSVLDPLGAVLAPFHTILDGARAAWSGATGLVSDLPQLSAYTLHNVTAFAVLVVFVVLSAAAWIRLGIPYGIYCAVALAFPLVARPTEAPLLSLQRFALVLFPCFIVLGTLRLGRFTYATTLAMSCISLVALVYFWTQGHFVA